MSADRVHGVVRLSRASANMIVAHGGVAFVVYAPGGPSIFANGDDAREFADRHGVEHVLDWETGEYADA